MALLNTVVRKYTPPTCTLEVRGRESLLSKWAKRPVLQDLKFKLSFDDPRQPDDKQVSIWGDREGLEALSTAVSKYIQNFLQSRGEVEVNGKQPIVDSLPRKQTNSTSAIDLPVTQIETNTTVTSNLKASKVTPISPVFQNQILNPYLKPKGLVTHELFLGALQTPESGASIDLSALQLFDLATALDAYGAEMLDMPSLVKTRPAIPLWGYAAGAAALVAAGVGLAPAAMKLANTSNVVVVEPSPDSSAVTAIPSSDLALAPTNPASPAPLASPGGANLPAQNNLTLGAVPPGSNIPPGTGSGTNIPPGAAPPGSNIPPGAIGNIPNLPTSLGNTGQSAPIGGSGLTPPPSTSGAGQAPVTSQNNSPNTARQRLSQRATQYSFPSGISLSPLGSGSSTSPPPSTASRSNPGKTFVVNPDKPSKSSRNTQNTAASGARQSAANKKSRNPVPTITQGQVQPYVDPGDNPSDLAASPAEIQPTESQAVESKKNGNSSPQRQVVRSQSPKKLEIADNAPTLPRFTAEDLAASSPLNSPGSSEPSEAEASDPVVPQFVPNASPPPLGEIPPLTDTGNASTQSPSPATELPNSPVATTSRNTPITVPAPTSAAVPNQPSSAIAPNSALDANTLAAVPVQATEVKRYFEGQWKPIKDVKQSLDYTLFLDKSGSITRIVPITEASARYIDRTGMPKLTNVPLVSPVGSPQMKIRVSLDPDGTVKTFQEP